MSRLDVFVEHLIYNLAASNFELEKIKRAKTMHASEPDNLDESSKLGKDSNEQKVMQTRTRDNSDERFKQMNPCLSPFPSPLISKEEILN